MREKKNGQAEFIHQVPEDKTAKVTLEYFSRYDWISDFLDSHAKILEHVPWDLRRPLAGLEKTRLKGGACRFTSDTVLRMVLVKIRENASFHGTIIKVDDSPRLRAFTRIYNGRTVAPSTLCLLTNAIRENTWKRINRLLAEAAAAKKRIDGERLRIDTTAVETIIHWPTDSGLLWDSHRVLSRLLGRLRNSPSCAGLPAV